MTSLTLKQAEVIIDKALEKAREMMLPAVVVLDDSGNIKTLKREDGASILRVDIGRAKAWGAVAMGCSSRALANRAKQNQNFFVTLAATAGGKFLPQQGGVLIRDAVPVTSLARSGSAAQVATRTNSAVFSAWNKQV